MKHLSIVRRSLPKCDCIRPRWFGSTSRIERGSLVQPDDEFRNYFQKYRLAQTTATIPYSKEIPFEKDNLSHDDRINMNRKKVTVVGMGNVGLGCVAAILNQNLCGSIVMMDPNEAKLIGEAKDFQQGAAFHQNTEILASSFDYSVSQDSDLVIITAGAAQQPGESRLALMDKNVGIMKSIIPPVLEHSPNATILIASNPCDIMTAIAAKIAGPDVPQGRILGTGTCLDSSRLQTLLAHAMNLDPNSVTGYIIGEHGDSSIPVWSSVKIGALPLLQANESAEDPILSRVHKAVVDAAYDVINHKGYTNWAIGMAAAHIAKAILHDTRSVIPVSTCVRGLYGVEEDVFLSLPCNLSSAGVIRIAILPLTDTEEETFRTCAKNIWAVQEPIWDKL